jgi:hypothetical protein
MVAKAKLEQPYLSVASIKMVDKSDAKYYGSVFLIRTAKHDRRDVVVGAGHSLVHLDEGVVYTEVRTFGNRDVNAVASRQNGSFRSAVAGKALPKDFGVAILQEPIPEFIEPGHRHVTPLLVKSPDDAQQIHVTVSGAIADEMMRGDDAIWLAETVVTTHGSVSYSAPNVTRPGMSGGPVVIANETASAIGLVHGNGTIDLGYGPVAKDLYVTLTKEHIALIDALIERALAG